MSDRMPEALLRVEGLSGRRLKRPSDRIQPRELVFQGLSFSVAAGERLAIVAQPGGGKAALLRTVAMLQRPASGRVFFEGRDIVRLGGGELRRLRQRLQYVGGDPRYLLPLAETVGQALLEPLRIHALGTAAQQQSRAEAAANLLGLSRLLLDRKVSQISPALRQRVALARAFTLQPRLMLCDELIDRLEAAAARPLLELVEHACRTLPEPAAWIWTTSDEELARAFSDRVLNLEAGRLELARE